MKGRGSNVVGMVADERKAGEKRGKENQGKVKKQRLIGNIKRNYWTGVPSIERSGGRENAGVQGFLPSRAVAVSFGRDCFETARSLFEKKRGIGGTFQHGFNCLEATFLQN